MVLNLAVKESLKNVRRCATYFGSNHYFVFMKEKEIWIDVPGYEGLYQVSSFGQVKSFRKKSGYILKLRLDITGYLRIFLFKDWVKRKSYNVHQLVAIAFLDHKPQKHKICVNHKDTNKLNNRLSNLEVVTHRENTNKKHIKSSSKYVGVYRRKRKSKWHAGIRINGKTKHLGSFVNEIDASNAYQEALKNIT